MPRPFRSYRLLGESTKRKLVSQKDKQVSENSIEGAYLFHERAEFTEFLQNGFMSNGLDILDVIKGLSFLVTRDAASGFTRINSLQDAETTEILDRDLKHLQASGTADKRRLQPSIVLFLSLAHPRQLSLGAHLGVARSLDGLLLFSSFHSISHVFNL